MYKSDHLGTTNRIQDVLSHPQGQGPAQSQLHCHNPGTGNTDLFLGHHVAPQGRHVSTTTNTCTIKPTATKLQPLSTTSVLRQWRRPDVHDALPKPLNGGLSSAPVQTTTACNRFVKEVTNYNNSHTNSQHSRYGENHTDIINQQPVVNNNSVQMYGGDYAQQDVSYYQHAEHSWQHQQHVPVATGYNLQKVYQEYQGPRMLNPCPMQKDPKQANAAELFSYAKSYASVQPPPHPNYNYYPHSQYDARYVYPNSVPPNRNGVIAKPLQKPAYPILEQRLNYYYPQPQTLPQQQPQPSQEVNYHQEYPYHKYAIPQPTHKIMSSSNPVTYRGLSADPYRGLNTDWKLREEYDSNVYLSKMNQMQTKLPSNPLDYQEQCQVQKYPKLPGTQGPNDYLYSRNRPNPVQYSQPQPYNNIPNIHYGSTTSEMPPRNISPRRTFQENMPVVVIPRQHIGLLKLSPPLYNSSDYLNAGQVVQPTPVQPFQAYQSAQVQQQPQHPYTQNVHANYMEQNVGNNSLGFCPKKDDIGKSLKEFLESWEDDEEIVSNLPDLVLCNNLPADKAKHDRVVSPTKRDNVLTSDQPLYVLDATDVSSEALAQYKHIQQIDRLPDNIKYYPDPKVPGVLESDQVLNLSTHRHNEFTLEKEQDESSSSTSEETSTNTTDNSDGDDTTDKAVEKCVTTSVIVPNTYFDTSKEDGGETVSDLHCTLMANSVRDDTLSKVIEFSEETIRSDEILKKMNEHKEEGTEIIHEATSDSNISHKCNRINEEFFDPSTKMHKETHAFDEGLTDRHAYCSNVEDIINDNGLDINMKTTQLNSTFDEDVPVHNAGCNSEETTQQCEIITRDMQEAVMKNVQQNTTGCGEDSMEQSAIYSNEEVKERHDKDIQETKIIQQNTNGYDEDSVEHTADYSEKTENHCKMIEEVKNIQQSQNECIEEPTEYSPINHNDEPITQNKIIDEEIQETKVKDIQNSTNGNGKDFMEQTNVKNIQHSPNGYDEEIIEHNSVYHKEEAKNTHEKFEENIYETSTKEIQVESNENGEEIMESNSDEAKNQHKTVVEDTHEESSEKHIQSSDESDEDEQTVAYNNEEAKNWYETIDGGCEEINLKNIQQSKNVYNDEVIEHSPVSHNGEAKDQCKADAEDNQGINMEKIKHSTNEYDDNTITQIAVYTNKELKNQHKDVQETSMKSKQDSKNEYCEDNIEDAAVYSNKEEDHQGKIDDEDFQDTNIRNMQQSIKEYDEDNDERTAVCNNKGLENQYKTEDEDLGEANMKNTQESKKEYDEVTFEQNEDSSVEVDNDKVDEGSQKIDMAESQVINKFDEDVNYINVEMKKQCELTDDLQESNVQKLQLLNVFDSNEQTIDNLEAKNYDEELVEDIQKGNPKLTPEGSVFDEDTVERIEVQNEVNEYIQERDSSTVEESAVQLPLCNDAEVEISNEDVPETVFDEPQITVGDDIEVQSEYEISNEEDQDSIVCSPNAKEFDENSTELMQSEHKVIADSVQEKTNNLESNNIEDTSNNYEDTLSSDNCEGTNVSNYDSSELVQNSSLLLKPDKESSLNNSVESEVTTKDTQIEEFDQRNENVSEVNTGFLHRDEKNIEPHEDEEDNSKHVPDKDSLDTSEDDLTSEASADESDTTSTCTDNSVEIPEDDNNIYKNSDSELVEDVVLQIKEQHAENAEMLVDANEEDTCLVASEEVEEQEISDLDFEKVIEYSEMCEEIVEPLETVQENLKENKDVEHSEVCDKISEPLSIVKENMKENVEERNENYPEMCEEFIEPLKAVEENNKNLDICEKVMSNRIESSEICEEFVAEESIENSVICEEIVKTSTEPTMENSEMREEIIESSNDVTEENLEDLIICNEIQESLIGDEKIEDSIICVQIMESEKDIDEENMEDSGICLEILEPLNVIVEEEVEETEICEEILEPAESRESEICSETPEETKFCLEVTESVQELENVEVCLQMSESLKEIDEPIESNKILKEIEEPLKEIDKSIKSNKSIKNIEEPLKESEAENTRQYENCLKFSEPLKTIEEEQLENSELCFERESKSFIKPVESDEDLEICLKNSKISEVQEPKKNEIDSAVEDKEIIGKNLGVTKANELETTDGSSDESSLEEGELVSESDSDCIFISSTKLEVLPVKPRKFRDRKKRITYFSDNTDSEEEILTDSLLNSEDEEEVVQQRKLRREIINKIKTLDNINKIEPVDNIEKKELFINPQNPLYEKLSSSLNNDTNNNRKRCVSSSETEQIIEFKAPKRRYSAFEAFPVKSVRPIINLDEISRNVQEVLENMSKTYDAKVIQNDEKAQVNIGNNSRRSSCTEFDKEESAEEVINCNRDLTVEAANQTMHPKDFIEDFSDSSLHKKSLDENSAVQIHPRTQKELFNSTVKEMKAMSPTKSIEDMTDNTLQMRSPSLVESTEDVQISPSALSPQRSLQNFNFPLKDMTELLEKINHRNSDQDFSDFSLNMVMEENSTDAISPSTLTHKKPFHNYNPAVRKLNQLNFDLDIKELNQPLKTMNSNIIADYSPQMKSSPVEEINHPLKTMNSKNFAGDFIEMNSPSSMVENVTDNIQISSNTYTNSFHNFGNSLNVKTHTEDAPKSYKYLSIERDLLEIDTNKFLFEDTFKECSLIASTVDFSHITSSTEGNSIENILCHTTHNNSFTDAIKTTKKVKKFSVDDKTKVKVKTDGKSTRKSSVEEIYFDNYSSEDKNKVNSESKEHLFDASSAKVRTQVDSEKHFFQHKSTAEKDLFDADVKKDTFENKMKMSLDADIKKSKLDDESEIEKLPFRDELVQNPKVLVTPLFPRRSCFDPRLNKDKFEEPEISSKLGSTFHLTDYTKNYIKMKTGHVTTDLSHVLTKPSLAESPKPKEDLKRKPESEPDPNDVKRIKINLQDYRNRKQTNGEAEPTSPTVEERTKEPKPKKRKKRFRNLYASDEEPASEPVCEPGPCDFKCHIRLDALGDSVVRNYEINRNGATKLTLTLKPKKTKPAFAEVLSSLDSVISDRVQQKSKKSRTWTQDDKVPKVIIKRNRNGYCAVYTDVSCNPIWQPKIFIKRHPHIEMLVSKYSKGR